MLKQAMSLLNEFVPLNLAVKGLEKLDPRFKKFLGAALGAGYGADKALDYVRKRIDPSRREGVARPEEESADLDVERSQAPEKGIAALAGAGLGAAGGAALAGLEGLKSSDKPEETQAPVSENIIAQFSPPLAQFLNQVIESGRTSIEAAGIAESPSQKFTPTIRQMEKTLGMKWYDIVRSVYGGPKLGGSSSSQSVRRPEEAAAPAPNENAQKMEMLGQLLQKYAALKKGG